jgi:hypothetical protein
VTLKPDGTGCPVIWVAVIGPLFLAGVCFVGVLWITNR